VDVRFNANAIGRVFVIILPAGVRMLVHCVRTAPRPSWHPSVVTMNGVPSYLCACRTG